MKQRSTSSEMYFRAIYLSNFQVGRCAGSASHIKKPSKNGGLKKAGIYLIAFGFSVAALYCMNYGLRAVSLLQFTEAV